jgi:hypothetical protein
MSPTQVREALMRWLLLLAQHEPGICVARDSRGRVLNELRNPRVFCQTEGNHRKERTILQKCQTQHLTLLPRKANWM